MAITRAQQVRQMLEDGGMLVKPSTDGKRPGYRSERFQSARSKSMSAGRSSPKSTGPSFNDQGSGDDNRQTYSAIQTQTGKVKGGGKGIGTDKRGNVVFEDDRPSQKAIDNAIKFQEEQKQKREEAIKRSQASNLLDFFDKRRQAYKFARALPGAAKSSYNNLIAYRDYLKSQGADLTTIDRLLEGVDEETPIGFDAFQELAYGYEPKGIEDIETLRGMFTDTTRGPFDKITAVPQTYSEFMLTQRNNPNLFAAGDLGNFMNMPKPKDLVNPNTGELYTNTEWNDLKRDIGQDRGLIEGMGGDPTDPCKGPNPPAYCFVNNDDDDDTTTPPPSTGVFAGIAPRFAGSTFDFDALRANAMDGGMIEDTPVGGIMDLESGRQMYFLGKLVKKAKRAVKKIAKSPFGKAALGAALFKFGGGFGGGKGLAGLKSTLFGQAASQAAGPMKYLQGTPFTKGLFGKLGLTTGGGSMMPTLKGGLALGFGVPLALDLLGVGKDDDKMDLDEYYRTQGINIADIRNRPYNFLADRFTGSRFAADGGLMRMGYQEGGDAEPVAKKTMPLIDMNGQEKDYRETGGFVDMGRMERADDVPARLSKNEFVFTADAVRNAGDGDIDKGAEVMYNMMKNLEAGGDVSEESQGLEGARNMFQTSQRLGEVL